MLFLQNNALFPPKHYQLKVIGYNNNASKLSNPYDKSKKPTKL